jgi:hypothetical protein
MPQTLDNDNSSRLMAMLSKWSEDDNAVEVDQLLIDLKLNFFSYWRCREAFIAKLLGQSHDA